MPELSPFSRVIATAAWVEKDLCVSEARYEAKLLLVGDHQVLAHVLHSQLLPPQANRVSMTRDMTLVWLGPRQWLVLTRDEMARRTGEAFAAIRSCFTLDARARFVGLTIQGAHAAELLATGCGLDFRDHHFPISACAQTRIEQAPITVFRRATAEYEVMVERPLAQYLWRWTQEAAREWLGQERKK